MLKKYLKKILPKHESVKEHRWLRLFGAHLQHHNLWHLHRRSVSGGVAIGLFCGLIPGPLQMIGALLLTVLFRVNLPVALVTTLYTNPLTIVPLYFLAYQLGALVTGQSQLVAQAQFVVPDMGWDNWFTVMVEWIISLGKPFAIGLPLLAVILALLGYVLVRVGWRIWVMWHWRKHGMRGSTQGQMLTFRPAAMADVERIVALVNSAYRGESSRAGWTTEADLLDGQRTDAEEVRNLIASADAIILLCMNGEEMIGSVHLQHGKQVAYLGMLVIQPGMQGRGLGKKLMLAAEATAIKVWDVDKMLMYVITVRQELIAFYERRGYHRTGKIKEFPQDVRFGIQKVSGLKIELLGKTL